MQSEGLEDGPIVRLTKMRQWTQTQDGTCGWKHCAFKTFFRGSQVLVSGNVHVQPCSEERQGRVSVCLCDTVRLSMHPVRLFGLFSKVLSYDIKPTEDAQQDRNTHGIGKLDSRCVLSRAACDTQDMASEPLRKMAEERANERFHGTPIACSSRQSHTH